MDHHHTFIPILKHPIPAMRIELQEYLHITTGARHLHIHTDDSHNAFIVAFLTAPQDSTGIAHILEHTVLCGSRRYPVRDPFFMMTRRSISTFMNACTSSDWTAYLFSSKNRKDFFNLMEVYLDAVFFPVLDERDFRQEGYRLEFVEPFNKNSALTFKGVVFNEMKGVLSIPTQRLSLALQSTLFPTTTYHHNSGGDPKLITNLDYQELKKFHAVHYHPSNAIFLTYGDISILEHQEKFYSVLSNFDKLDKKISIPDEKRLVNPISKSVYYPLASTEQSIKDKTHIVLGWLLFPVTKADLVMRMRLLNSILLDNSSSPLRYALETSNLGTALSPLCGFDTSTRETTFSCGLEGSNPECAPEVEKLIIDVLRRVVSDGISMDVINSALHQLEISRREITGDNFPYCLRLLTDALVPAIHGGDWTTALDIEPLMNVLRTESQSEYFIRNLVKKYLLDNYHRVLLTMLPDGTLSTKDTLTEENKLKAVYATLSEGEKDHIISKTHELLKRQQQLDDPEILPRIHLIDVPLELKIPEGKSILGNTPPVDYYTCNTNGISYIQAVITIPQLSIEELDLLPILSYCLTNVGIAGRDYCVTQAKQAAVTGGISASVSVYGKINDINTAYGVLVISGKSLNTNFTQLSQIIWETLNSARFDELERIRELIFQYQVQQESLVTNYGHIFALSAACSNFSPVAIINNRWHGLQSLKNLHCITNNLKNQLGLQELSTKLLVIMEKLRKSNRHILIISDIEKINIFAQALESHWSNSPPNTPGNYLLNWPISQPITNLGFYTDTQVNFCAEAYPTVAIDHADAPALRVLGEFLRNGYLHRAVREQGGAYGCGARYHADSNAFQFYSYRDPHLLETFNEFHKSINWFLNNTHLSRALEESILGVIASIDKPVSPASEAKTAFFNNLVGLTPKQIIRFRKKVLEINMIDLQRVAYNYLTPDRVYQAVISNQQVLTTLQQHEHWVVNSII